MKTNVYARSKNKWSEREALLDILTTNNLKAEQLQPEHNEKQYRWRVKPEESNGFFTNLLLIAILIFGGIVGVSYLKSETNFFDNFSGKDVEINDNNSNDNDVDNSVIDNDVDNSVNDNYQQKENNRKIICPNCNGRGGDYVIKDCNTCKGYGLLAWEVCYNCKGKRKEEVKIPCEVCNGEGRVNEYE